MSTTEPLSDDRLQAIRERLDAYCGTHEIGVHSEAVNALYAYAPADLADLLAEVERLRAVENEHSEDCGRFVSCHRDGDCPHTETLVDDEHDHRCPWCTIVQLLAEVQRLRAVADGRRTVYSVQHWVDADGIHDGWCTGYGHYTGSKVDAAAQLEYDQRTHPAERFRLASAQITEWREAGDA